VRENDPMAAGVLVFEPAAATRSPVEERRQRDRELVAACQRGEREAFDELMERYQRDIYRLCFRYVGNPEDAGDMAQETFIRAYKAIGRFRGQSAFSTWLYRIAVNACLNFRSARRPAAAELPAELPDRGESTLVRLEEEERSREVRRAVSELPDRQRATLILKVFHELTHQEVAEILGSSVGTVKANLFHALANLRKRLGVGAAPPGTEAQAAEGKGT
jgi:RNA polymerase sigma-70 factor (ECF subfamily)